MTTLFEHGIVVTLGSTSQVIWNGSRGGRWREDRWRRRDAASFGLAFRVRTRWIAPAS